MSNLGQDYFWLYSSKGSRQAADREYVSQMTSNTLFVAAIVTVLSCFPLLWLFIGYLAKVTTWRVQLDE